MSLEEGFSLTSRPEFEKGAPLKVAEAAEENTTTEEAAAPPASAAEAQETPRAPLPTDQFPPVMPEASSPRRSGRRP